MISYTSICVVLSLCCVWSTNIHTRNLRLVVQVRKQVWIWGHLVVFVQRGVLLQPLWWKESNVVLNVFNHLFHGNIPWKPSKMERWSRSQHWVSITSSATVSVSWQCSVWLEDKSSPSVYNHLTVRCPMVHEWYFYGVNSHQGLGQIRTWTMPFHNLSYVI